MGRLHSSKKSGNEETRKLKKCNRRYMEIRRSKGPGAQIVQNVPYPLCLVLLSHPPKYRYLVCPELQRGLLIEFFKRHMAATVAGILLQIMLSKRLTACGQLVQIDGSIRPIRQSQIRRDIGKTRPKRIFMYIEDDHLHAFATPPQVIRQKVLMYQSSRQSSNTLT